MPRETEHEHAGEKQGTAFLFPGQGSQFPGMGRDLYYLFPATREIYRRADRHLGFRISETCFRGPEDMLFDPAISTLAILVTSIATFKAAVAAGHSPQLLIGHSFGLYSSLVAGGALRLEDALDIVRLRSKSIQKAATEIPSGMTAVIGLSRDQLQQIVDAHAAHGFIDISVYNGPKYFLLSGERGALRKARAAAKKAGADLVLDLSIKAGLHCRLMEPVKSQLESHLTSFRLQKPSVPILDPSTLRKLDVESDLADLLASEVVSPVRWDRVVRFLDGKGFKHCLEIGSRSIIRGILRRAGSACNVSPVYSGHGLSRLRHAHRHEWSSSAGSASTVAINLANLISDVSLGLIARQEAIPLLTEMKRTLDSAEQTTRQSRILRSRISEIEHYIGHSDRSIPIGLLA